MKGRMAKAVTMTGALGLAWASAGCWCCYWDKVDPCYPERYEYQARETVDHTMNTQIINGHILDQTIWNAYFDPGTDRLTPAGMRQLASLARRRPNPDPVIYLQTACDIAIDPVKLEESFEARNRLDVGRKIAVERFMLAQTGGSIAFQVMIPHDPPMPSLFGQEAISIIQDIRSTAHGTLSGGGAGGGSTGGGSSGGSSSGGSSYGGSSSGGSTGGTSSGGTSSGGTTSGGTGK